MSVPILVVGAGNPLLGDDGVGPRAIEALGRRYQMPGEVQLLDGGTAGLGLIAELSEAHRILILDAVRTRKCASGTVVTLAGDALARAPRGLFPHEVGLSDVVGTLRLMGRSPEIVVIGIEAETVTPGLGLSAPVAASFERLLRAAVRQLRRWGVEIAKSPDRPITTFPGHHIAKWPDHQIARSPDHEISHA